MAFSLLRSSLISFLNTSISRSSALQKKHVSTYEELASSHFGSSFEDQFTRAGTAVHDMTKGDHRAVELFLLHLREQLEEHLIRTGRKSRLQWETWRSYNNERYRLPPLLTTPRTHHSSRSYLSRYPSFQQPTRYQHDPYAASGIYDEQMESLHGKLKPCEKILTSKERKIQQLEEQIEKLNHKRSAP